MACHNEVLEAASVVVASKGINEFTPHEIVSYMNNHNTTYAESTIRTHIISRCCINAPAHHAVRYAHFERISHGLYKIIR